MDDTAKPETVSAIEPYHLGDFAKGGKIDFLTQGNVSIPLSIELLRAIVPVRQGEREPNTTEMVMFVNAVIEQGCNCYLNECWLVLMRGKYVPIIAAQKRIAKAQSIPSYDGYEWGWIDKDGIRWPAGPGNKVKEADIVGGWGRIYFKDRKVPFYHEIFRSEYKYPKSERKITMLLKTLRDQLHRYAFANEMGNLCTENEPYEEPLPAPESDVPPRDKRRMPVPSTAVDTTRAPVQEAVGPAPVAEEKPKPEAVPAAIPVSVVEAIAEVKKPDPDAEARAKEANEPQEKPESELVTFVCKVCGETFQYGKEEGKGKPCSCGKGLLVEVEKQPEPAEPSIEEKGDKASLYVEVNGMYVAQGGKDFIEFASFVLCIDDSEIAPSKLTEEQLKQIAAYIETSGVAIS